MVGIAQYVMVICQRFDHLHYLLVTLTFASNVVCAHVKGDINDCIIDHKHYIISICRMTVTAANAFIIYSISRGVRRISLEGVRCRRAEKLSAVLLYRFILFFTDNFNVSKIGSLVVSSAVPICNGAV